MNTKLAYFTVVGALLAALPLTGCDKGDQNTGTASSSGTDSGTTGADTDTGDSMTSTSGGTTAGSDSATGAATGGQESATDGTGNETTGGTTGEPDPDPAIVEACEAVCAKYAECFPEEGTVEECVEDCTHGTSSEAECVGPIVDYYECGAMQTCDAFAGNEEFCVEEEAAIPEQCFDAGDVCTVGVGGNEQGTACEYMESCPGYEYHLVCEGETCTCIEDGVEVKSCPIMDACADNNSVDAYAATCCGW